MKTKSKPKIKQDKKIQLVFLLVIVVLALILGSCSNQGPVVVDSKGNYVSEVDGLLPAVELPHVERLETVGGTRVSVYTLDGHEYVEFRGMGPSSWGGHKADCKGKHHFCD